MFVDLHNFRKKNVIPLAGHGVFSELLSELSEHQQSALLCKHNDNQKISSKPKEIFEFLAHFSSADFLLYLLLMIWCDAAIPGHPA